MGRIKEALQSVNQKLKECVTQEDIKELIRDVKFLKESMNNAQQDIKSLWDEFNKLKAQVDSRVYPSMNEFNALKMRVDKLENQVA